MCKKMIKNIIQRHEKWLRGEKRADAKCASLRGHDLRGVDLRGAYLRCAEANFANFAQANLEAANFQSANLQSTNFVGSKLMRANFQNANLEGADFLGATLTGAILYGAFLNNAKNIPELIAARLMACPESGAFVGWKKCKDGIIVKLSIPADAKRSSATTRKCRAEFVDVLEVVGADEAVSLHDGGKTVYRVGERVHCNKWDDDRWNECSGGIHFFITRCEAENY